MKEFEELRWCKMIDYGMDPSPEYLGKSILTESFVYCREHGLFYVRGGCHQIAMSLLLSWKYGLNDGIDVAKKLGLKFSGETAELWLKEEPGALVLSSIGSTPYAYCIDNLNFQEKKFFGKIDYLF